MEIEQVSRSYTAIEKQIIENVRQQQFRKRLGKRRFSKDREMLTKVIESCVHIISDYFGSGFCISADGKIITCAHCVYDDEVEEMDGKQIIQIIFASGEIYECKVLYHELDLDCALLQIIGTDKQNFPFFEIADKNAEDDQEVYCIGQPGYEDLETESKEYQATGYDSFHISDGQIRGYLRNKIQVCKKSDLGPMKHDCWTYWGHSGAPIFDLDGKIIGMHNSWNPKNAMRHGLSTQTIKTFIQTCQQKGIIK